MRLRRRSPRWAVLSRLRPGGPTARRNLRAARRNCGLVVQSGSPQPETKQTTETRRARRKAVFRRNFAQSETRRFFKNRFSPCSPCLCGDRLSASRTPKSRPQRRRGHGELSLYPQCLCGDRLSCFVATNSPSREKNLLVSSTEVTETSPCSQCLWW